MLVLTNELPGPAEADPVALAVGAAAHAAVRTGGDYCVLNASVG